MYTTDIVFAPLAAGPLLNIVNLFIEDLEIKEFTQKFAKISLAQYFSSVKKSKAASQKIVTSD